MSSALRTPPAVPSHPAGHADSSPVPPLDELERMTSIPDERHVIRNVSWAFYEQLVEAIPEDVNIHVDYDGKDVEIMSPSVSRRWKKLFGQLVEAIAQELESPYKSAGGTTWKRPEIARGLESDECYFLRSR